MPKWLNKTMFGVTELRTSGSMDNYGVYQTCFRYNDVSTRAVMDRFILLPNENTVLEIDCFIPNIFSLNSTDLKMDFVADE